MAKAKKNTNLIKISIGITFVSLIYKIALVYLAFTLILLIATIPTLIVLICKVLYLKNVNRSRLKKHKAYLFMFISILIYSLIFIMFVVFKINGIDISKDNTYTGIVGTIFILVLLIMLILSIVSLKGALKKTDIMVIGLKEIALISALSDSVIVEEYISRIILEYKEIDILVTINNYYTLGVGILMLLISFFMLIRLKKYKA
ncbi:MAG: hypothetical protein K6E20_00990 [Acholeplasmatales bacterium]|nr:hypothetical protein [Acholeplasmatales bacterium]